jgi:uncharacterized membrane protein YgcG
LTLTLTLILILLLLPPLLQRLAFADLSPYINLAPLTVRDCCPLGRVFTHFRTMGLRHAVVVDRHNAVVGIITRKDLAKLQHPHHSSPRASGSGGGSPSPGGSGGGGGGGGGGSGGEAERS